ncbi:oligopeptide ABC transporter ATP-binding protein OppF [Spiroplasma taiwanense]|uniref:Oligopeptide ABC transporter ATP-binding protein n=1 Tax=Spiroplasma taiwanense CT-1 TaxID=1276220 RepID=S5MCL0_9MOLU|nr:oligopeptide ABC transporter ATP-binding protein OppF [Spiroplasma taiwanense]AGR41458.1 oligopeptide ABC transporter ATP-binding protein [Spiroplasma taiwanense CT-1]
MSKFYEENAFLKIRDAKVVFRSKGSKLNAVKETNLNIKKGEILGLVGESGSGKTTLERAIVGIQQLKDGAIYMENDIIAGKSARLFILNKEITKKLYSMKIKMNATTIYLNDFINNLKKNYKQNPNFENFSNEDFKKNFKKNEVEFIDNIFLSNLKYINRILLNEERIIRFITNISKSIDEISLDLEKTILLKQNQVKNSILQLKKLLDEIYEIAQPILKLQKKYTCEDIDVKTIFINIFQKLDKIIINHKKFLEKLDETINYQYENQALSAPFKRKNKFLNYYYKKIFINRNDFLIECKRQIELLKEKPNFEKDETLAKYNYFINDFWSKNNMNINGCTKILTEMQKVNPNFSMLKSISKDLKNTDFENELKDILINNNISQKNLNDKVKEFDYIKKIVKRNIIKDRELIDEYMLWKNIESDISLEEWQNLEEFVQFLEMPSIDEIVNKSYLFKGQTKKEKKQIRKNVQMIFQDPGSSLNDRMAVEEIIGEGLENFPELYKSEEIRNEYMINYNQLNPEQKITLEQVKNKDVKKYLILNALTSVGLIPEHLSRYPHEFSGGQRQRIGIARSLIMKPKIIVADEPISALDVSIRAQVLNLFKKFKEELGITFIFVAHDLSVVHFIADRIAVIYHGQIVELADANELFINPLHPYTKALLSSIPIPEPELAKKEKSIIYNSEKEHSDYMFDLPRFTEIKPNHFVYLNKRELKEIKDKL